MKQLLLLTAMAITCVLAATANVVIARTIGINFFTMKVWFVIPIGAALVGMLGASGAILAARYFRIVPKILDAAFMVIIAAATMILIYYLDYATLVLDDGRRASDLIDFGSYVDLVLTKSHMRVGRAGQIDTGNGRARLCPGRHRIWWLLDRRCCDVFLYKGHGAMRRLRIVFAQAQNQTDQGFDLR